MNTLPWPRSQYIDISENEGALAQGSGILLTLTKLENLAGFNENGGEDGSPVFLQEKSDGVFVLENQQLRVEVEGGIITSLFDKQAEREVIPKGQKANQYVIYDDKPLYWQAWDVEVYHLDTRKEVSGGKTKVHEQKKHRVSVVTSTKISELSSVETVISLSAAVHGEQSWVEVSSKVDWHETMKFLKVEFPVDVRNTEANYECQFGYVKRPTHYNTSWDMAKFEVCCHKFADLSENGYGVSILNDSKYGFATVGSLMRLSLLRSPKAPDAHADMGTHHIRWAIMPHQGSLGSTTVRKAYEFNNPLKLLSCNDIKANPGSGWWWHENSIYLTSDSSPSLVIDTVKRGEDDEDVSRGELPKKKGRSVILRIYDSLGGRARGTIQTPWAVTKVSKTNVLEDELEEIEVKNLDYDGTIPDEKSFKVDLKPFEIATYKIQLKD